MEIASWYPLSFYKNDNIVSKYHPDNGRITQVVRSVEYETIRNNYYDDYKYIDMLGQEDFFSCLQSLLHTQPHEALKQFPGCENSEYSDIALSAKNAYLSSCIIEAEDVAYSVQVKNNSRSVFNSLLVYDNCQNIFSSRSIIQSYNIFYCSTIQNSNNLRFCANMI